MLQIAINDGNYYEMVNGGQNLVGHAPGWNRWYTAGGARAQRQSSARLLVAPARRPRRPGRTGAGARGDRLTRSTREASRHDHVQHAARPAGEDQAGAGPRRGDLRHYEPQPGCQTYAGYVAWLALNGARGDVALALIANFAAWGSYCGAVAGALRSRYGFDDKARGFFDFFATPVPEVEEQALAVAQDSVNTGEPPELARRYARLIQAYELSFWNTLADGVPETA